VTCINFDREQMAGPHGACRQISRHGTVIPQYHESVTENGDPVEFP
jgi:hypothetical protein